MSNTNASNSEYGSIGTPMAYVYANCLCLAEYDFARVAVQCDPVSKAFHRIQYYQLGIYGYGLPLFFPFVFGVLKVEVC